MLVVGNVAHADTVKVQSGDTLSKIAQDHNTSVDSIIKLNSFISNANLIFVGQELELDDNSQHQNQVVTVAQPVAQNIQKPVKKVDRAVQPQLVSNSSAKQAIAMRESGGSYTARNNRYYGRYQLDTSYLHGDYSPANQERVADQYVQSRYGSWENALQHSYQFGWY